MEGILLEKIIYLKTNVRTAELFFQELTIVLTVEDRELTKISHPAKYSDEIMPILEKYLIGYENILDPFAGSGKLRKIRPDAYLLEIEKEWAELSGATWGDFYNPPWPDGFFDAIVTSPTYGNRMADKLLLDGTKRNTYANALERNLSLNNTGRLQWGRKYRESHYEMWRQVYKLLRVDGRFILNIKDHIRNKKVMPVSRFHRLIILRIGFDLESEYKVKVPSLRYGENYGERVDYENIFIFRKKQ